MACKRCGGCCKGFVLQLAGVQPGSFGIIQPNNPGFTWDVYDAMNLWLLQDKIREWVDSLELSFKADIHLTFECPFLKDGNECTIYDSRYKQCMLFLCDKAKEGEEEEESE